MTIADLAYEALIQEVSLSHKPGLVEKDNSGSHTDMDYDLFLKSARALKPHFINYVKIGQTTEKERMFQELREEGIKAEHSMFEATNGINTHKGMNFIFALLCGGIGYLYQHQQPISDIHSFIADISSGLLKDFDDTLSTAGQKQYVQLGLLGIRGMAMDGFSILKEIKLRSLTEDELRKALFILMSRLNDSTIIKRGSLEALEYVKFISQKILTQKLYTDTKYLKDLNHEFVRRNLSPGGSADLLAAKIFLYTITIYYHQLEG